MTMNRNWTAVALLAVLAGGIRAQAAPVPDDFAFAIPLEVDGDGAIYSLELPAAVYRSVVQGVKVDLRVFNSRGEVVPHRIEAPAVPGPGQDVRGAALFPLHRPAGAAAGTVPRVHVTTDARGTIIDISGSAPARGEERPWAWLVDLGEDWQRVQALHLQWAQAGDRPRMSHVRIEYSGDLAHWQPLVARAAVGRLEFGGRVLERKRVELPRSPARYLRLVPEAPRDFPRLQGITAVRSVGPRPAPLRWTPAQPVAGPGEGAPAAWVFDAGGRFPVERVRVRLPEVNSVAEVVVSGRDGAQDAWRVRSRGLVYRLRLDGGELVQEEVPVGAAVTHRQWRVELLGEGGTGNAAPALELGWRPHRLLFVARGDAPFRLAYGSARVGPPRGVVAPLLDAVRRDGGGQLIKRARAGAPVVLGGESRLVPPPPERVVPWRRWILWAVLVAGVLLVAGLVRGLYRELRGSGDH